MHFEEQADGTWERTGAVPDTACPKDNILFMLLGQVWAVHFTPDACSCTDVDCRRVRIYTGHRDDTEWMTMEFVLNNLRRRNHRALWSMALPDILPRAFFELVNQACTDYFRLCLDSADPVTSWEAGRASVHWGYVVVPKFDKPHKESGVPFVHCMRCFRRSRLSQWAADGMTPLVERMSEVGVFPNTDCALLRFVCTDCRTRRLIDGGGYLKRKPLE